MNIAIGMGKLKKEKSNVTIQREIPKERNSREKNIAHSFISLKSDDKIVVNIVFHKNLSGYIMIGLNKKNQPIKAWSDLKGFMPIKTRLIKKNHFRDILLNYKPNCIYLNDGVLLAPLEKFKLHIYDMSLMNLLNKLRNDGINNDIEKNNFIPNYSDIKKLDSTITYKDYKKIYCNG